MTDSPRADHLVVHTTAPDQDVARAIARALLSAHLAASVQIIGPIESHYWWNDQVTRATEYLCVIKTTRAAYARVEAAIIAAHPYVTPEVFATPLICGSADYLAWIDRYARGNATGT